MGAKMKILASLMLALSVLFTGVAAAQLPSGSNVHDVWRQGTMNGIRIFYGYTHLDYNSSEPTFSCRIDYYHDGRIKLVATEGYYHIPNSPVSDITTFYSLKPTPVRDHGGYWLERVSYKMLSSPDLKAEPVITSEDLFAKRCVPLLGDLFRQIPAPESKMWKGQYGSIFGVK